MFDHAYILTLCPGDSEKVKCCKHNLEFFPYRVASTSTFQNSPNFPHIGVRVQLLNISIDIHINLFLCKYK